MEGVRYPKKEKNVFIEDTLGVVMVFTYIFSFFILGPITSSICAAAIALPTCLSNTKTRSLTLAIFRSHYLRGVVGLLLLLMTLCIFYSTVHLTHDFNYLKVLLGQLIQIIAGGIIVSYLYLKCDVTIERVFNWIIIAYLIQSCIELTAASVPKIASSLNYFNHAGEFQELSGGVRGMALASGTTWSLGLTYGMTFILYFSFILGKEINLMTTIGLIGLIIGTIFAGRTGFVGAAIGGMFFLLFGRKNIFQKSKLLLYIIAILAVVIMLVYLFAPSFVEYMIFNVIPWAFEPIVKYIDKGEFTTGSTEVLDNMWKETPTIKEAICGVGLFIGPDGAYYRHTDVGILRNLFYWGIGGYFFVIVYQLYLLWPMLINKTYRLSWFFLTVYLFVCEYKAMTLGHNKQAVSWIFLVSLIASTYPLINTRLKND